MPSDNWDPCNRLGQSYRPHSLRERLQAKLCALPTPRTSIALVAREPDPAFQWKKLEGKSLVADHGGQPLAMLRHAIRTNGADWGRIHAIDAGAPEEMQRAFHRNGADYIHLQAPASHQLEAEAVTC